MASNPPDNDAVAAANAALRDADWAERQGLVERAIAAYRRVLAIFPDVYQAQNNLANLLVEARRPAEALAHAERAHALQPADPLTKVNMGRALLLLDRPADAVPYLESALAAQPGQHLVRDLLARALLEAGRVDDAARVFRSVEHLAADDFELLGLMAKFFHRAKLGMDAERCLLRMRELRPDHAPVYGDLAELYVDFAQFAKAAEVARDGLRIDPGSRVFLNTLANSLSCLGFVHEALEHYRTLLSLAPDLALVHSNMLLAMHYPTGLTRDEIFAEHLRFARMHAPAALANTEFANAPEPGRRLRIGFLSPDIRTHSVAFFLEPLLDHRDRAAFEFYCYAAVKTPDAVTQRLRGKFDAYRNVVDLPCKQVARLVMDDSIDILVDLAGHAGNDRLQTLAYRPAPVQATWLGYPDTTGLPTVDYRLTDWQADPPGAEAFNVERLVRLPRGFLCYRPPDDAPEPGPAPALARGHVTFGSFNREFKISQAAWDLWGRVLTAVPGSRMVIKAMAAQEPRTRDYLLGELARRGVGPERVELRGFIPTPGEHLRAYWNVDVALDTFPYHGTTTTLDALYMGVPVITRAGDTHASRVGASVLGRVGLGELVARDDDGYVAAAVALAGDADRIGELHATLRARLLASPLCDGPGFARQFEAALRAMWFRWCEARGTPLTADQRAAVGAALDAPPA